MNELLATLSGMNGSATFLFRPKTLHAETRIIRSALSDNAEPIQMDRCFQKYNINSFGYTYNNIKSCVRTVSMLRQLLIDLDVHVETAVRYNFIFTEKIPASRFQTTSLLANMKQIQNELKTRIWKHQFHSSIKTCC